jgi:hypothetical protein
MTRVGKHGSDVGHTTTVVVPELRSQTTIEAIWTHCRNQGPHLGGQLDARQARHEGKSDSGYDEKNRGSCLETPGEERHDDQHREQQQQRLQGRGHASHIASCCRSARCTKPDQHVPKLRLGINPISPDLVRVMRQGAFRSAWSG